MATVLYNPRYIEVEHGKRLPNNADIKSFVWSHAHWSLKVNEMKKFPDDVGEALLKHCEFLIKVDSKNLKEIQVMMKEKKFKCSVCEFETDTRVALVGHMRSHSTELESGEIANIEEARPIGTYRRDDKLKRRLTPDESAGIPKEGKDRDNVEWYGEGIEKDKI